MSELITTEETTLAEFDKVTAAIEQLNEEFAGKVYDIETPKGLKDCMTDRSKIRKIRTSTEKMRKDFKAPLTARGKLIDSTAKRIRLAAEELEGPRVKMIEAEEQRKAKIKAEAEEKERLRVKCIQDVIHQLRDSASRCGGMTSDQIAGNMGMLRTYPTEAGFDEFKDQAEAAIELALKDMESIHDQMAVQEHADESRRIEGERLKKERAAIEAEKAEIARAKAEREPVKPIDLKAGIEGFVNACTKDDGYKGETKGAVIDLDADIPADHTRLASRLKRVIDSAESLGIEFPKIHIDDLRLALVEVMKVESMEEGGKS